MRAGKLDQLATFRRRMNVSDGGGGYQTTWSDQFRVWSAVTVARPRVTAEAIANGVETAMTRAVLAVRDNANTRTVTAGWRVVLAGRTWDVKEVAPVAEYGIRAMAIEAGALD